MLQGWKDLNLKFSSFLSFLLSDEFQNWPSETCSNKKPLVSFLVGDFVAFGQSVLSSVDLRNSLSWSILGKELVSSLVPKQEVKKLY